MNATDDPLTSLRVATVARLVRDWARRKACSLMRWWAESRQNTRVTVVFGMRRSGNHLLIGWLYRNNPGPCLHVNNISQDQPPFERRVQRARWSRLMGEPRIILSYEDQDIATTLDGPLGATLADFRDRLKLEVEVVTVLRDPWNLFASRFKKWPERRHDRERLEAEISLYKGHAGRYMKPEDTIDGFPLHQVIYNRFVTERPYRQAMASRLGVLDGDGPLQEVPSFGHGSSFDGTALAGKGSRMDVMARWRHFEQDPDFRIILDDVELRAIDEALAPAGDSTP